MALTVDFSDWTSGTGAGVNKEFSVQAALNSKLRLYKAKVTFGAADDYATNGVSIETLLKADNRSKNIIAAIPSFNDAGVTVQYNDSTGKMLAYGTAAHSHDILVTGGGTIVADGALGVDASAEIVKVEASDVTIDGDDGTNGVQDNTAAALGELPNSSQLLRSKVFEFIVFAV